MKLQAYQNNPMLGVSSGTARTNPWVDDKKDLEEINKAQFQVSIELIILWKTAYDFENEGCAVIERRILSYVLL